MATLGSDNQFPKILLTNSGDSATPAAGLAKLYVNASKVLHYKDDAGVDIALGTGGTTTPVGAAYKRTSGNYTTTSATMVSVDGTNLALTITTLARRVMIGLVGTQIHSSTVDTSFDVDIDGTLQGAPVSAGIGGLVTVRNPTALRENNVSFTYLSNVLSAGSHTFTLKWCTAAATATLYGATGPSNYMQFWVAETLMTA